MGIRGSGLATSLTSIMMFLAMAGVVTIDRRFRRYPSVRPLLAYRSGAVLAAVEAWRVIGMLLLFETALFSISGLVMGNIGRNSVAAYAIALQLASITFMIPLGLSQAATVRVGLFYGAREREGIRRAGWTSFFLGTGFMAFTALAMIAIPETLISLFLDRDDPKAAPVFALAVSFLFFAALFQIVDGAQAVAGGMLRGLQDTRIPLILGGIGYWGIGMPLGLWLAFEQGMQGRGVWMGLASGLAFVAVHAALALGEGDARLELAAAPLACIQIFEMQTLAWPAPMKPSFLAAPLERSITRPLMNGPRSLMRTIIDLPVLAWVTRTFEPSGSVLWAAVMADGFIISPEAVRECNAYHEAPPHLAAKHCPVSIEHGCRPLRRRW